MAPVPARVLQAEVPIERQIGGCKNRCCADCFCKSSSVCKTAKTLHVKPVGLQLLQAQTLVLPAKVVQVDVGCGHLRHIYKGELLWEQEQLQVDEEPSSVLQW